MTVCHCPPGKNRAMYNISRAFRTAEAQRILAILGPRFGEGQVRSRVEQAASYSAAQNKQEEQKRLLYDFEPPSHGTTVEMERKIRDFLQKRQESSKGLFDQGDELGRVQWSAVNIIGSYVKFDSVGRFSPFKASQPTSTAGPALRTTMLGCNDVSGKIRPRPPSRYYTPD